MFVVLLSLFIIIIFIFLYSICYYCFQNHRNIFINQITEEEIDNNVNHTEIVVESEENLVIDNIDININPSVFDIMELLERNTITHNATKEEECVICLDTINKKDIVRSLRCIHTFHKECIDEWYKSKIFENLICPICENDIIEDNINHS